MWALHCSYRDKRLALEVRIYPGVMATVCSTAAGSYPGDAAGCMVLTALLERHGEDITGLIPSTLYIPAQEGHLRLPLVVEVLRVHTSHCTPQSSADEFTQIVSPTHTHTYKSAAPVCLCVSERDRERQRQITTTMRSVTYFCG